MKPKPGSEVAIITLSKLHIVSEGDESQTSRTYDLSRDMEDYTSSRPSTSAPVINMNQRTALFTLSSCGGNVDACLSTDFHVKIQTKRLIGGPSVTDEVSIHFQNIIIHQQAQVRHGSSCRLLT